MVLPVSGSCSQTSCFWTCRLKYSKRGPGQTVADLINGEQGTRLYRRHTAQGRGSGRMPQSWTVTGTTSPSPLPARTDCNGAEGKAARPAGQVCEVQRSPLKSWCVGRFP